MGAVKRARFGLKHVTMATPKATSATGKIQPGQVTSSAVMSTWFQP